MNLPQRKKSAEEIAKLREELGVFAQPPAPSAVSQQPPIPAPPVEHPLADPRPEAASAFSNVPPVAATPLPPVDQLPTQGISPLMAELPQRAPKPVSSLRKSERLPALPQVIPVEDHPPGAVTVKSLRKSEQLPLPVLQQTAPANSHLPSHRHSDRDLNTLRQREAMAARMAPLPPKLTAPLPLLILGYFLAIMGTVLTFLDTQMFIPAACEALAILITAFVFIKKPQSRAHASLIFVIAFFSTLYVVFHFSPNLRHVP